MPFFTKGFANCPFSSTIKPMYTVPVLPLALGG